MGEIGGYEILTEATALILPPVVPNRIVSRSLCIKEKDAHGHCRMKQVRAASLIPWRGTVLRTSV
ncbi:hypothetical protein D3C76_1419620 [compost metagenome]